jgi:hypothetical protein
MKHSAVVSLATVALSSLANGSPMVQSRWDSSSCTAKTVTYTTTIYATPSSTASSKSAMATGTLYYSSYNYVAKATATASSSAKSSAYSAKATGSYRVKRDVNKALADCATAPSPATCTGVVNAIQGWDESVNEVNAFLNDASSESGAGLTDDAQNALNFANKEPGFLGVLMSTPNLDAAGQGAASTLANEFGVIPQTLQELVAGTRSASDAVDIINELR